MTNVASMKHSSSSSAPFSRSSFDNVRQNQTQNLVAAPSLKFTEGFDTRDLTEAKTPLEEFGS